MATVELPPELREHIIQYLDFAALKYFSLVCKAWHLSAHPVLWKHFSFKVRRVNLTPSEEYTVWLETIRKNAHSFKRIYDIKDDVRTPEIGELLLDRCHSLVTIEAATARRDTQNTPRFWEETLRPLIERNRSSLQQLQLRMFNGPFMTSLQLTNLLPNLSHLLSLGLIEQEMTVEALLPVLDACPRSLERLSLGPYLRRANPDQKDSIALGRKHHSPTNTTPLRLKHLHVGCCYDNTLEEILSRIAVHSLEELYITAAYSLWRSPSQRNGLWRLTRLHIVNVHRSCGMSIRSILDAIQPHHLRHAHFSKVDSGVIAMLIEQQHQSLEFLNVDLGPCRPDALANILETCVSLKSLVFAKKPFADIRMLIYPQRPWVCTELEVFDGAFGLSPFPSRHIRPPPPISDAEHLWQVEDQFMQRLGQLTKLRRLVKRNDFLDQIVTTEIDMEIMGWSLSSGLRHLADLANLQSLEFVGGELPKGIGKAEMMFVKQHWHCLKEMACRKINDSGLEDWLATEWSELKVTQA